MSVRALHQFRGGLSLHAHKLELQGLASRDLAVAPRLVLPLSQHVGVAAEPVVAPGQYVRRGELIAANVSDVSMRLHAPSSGTVTTIGEFPVIHASGRKASAIEITTDGLDLAVDTSPPQDPFELDTKEITARIAAAGIVGLGGAGFPAHIKIREGVAQNIGTLIVNGVECEPYIACDDRTLQEFPRQVLDGARLLARTLNAGDCVLAIEENMPAARLALEHVEQDAVEIVCVPTIYPAGGEKQLITTLTGLEVPSGSLPINIGVAVLNVQTVLAVYRAVVANEPLTRRMLTVAGDIPHQGNYTVAIGTPVRNLLDTLGILPSSNQRVMCGGPMMGTEISDLDSPITKTANCVLILENKPTADSANACIRCGECIPVCPMGLQPQQLLETVRVSDFDAAQDFGLFDCIECGCCAYVCPSCIPLVHYYRYAKSSIEAMDDDRARSDVARKNYAARQQRLSQLRQRGETNDELAALPPRDGATIRNDITNAVKRAAEKFGGDKQ